MVEMSVEEYRQIMGMPMGKLRNKHGNIKIKDDGYTFASQLEHKRYCQLKILRQAGKVKGFHVQPSLVLAPGVRYVADFIVFGNDGDIWLEDTKGFETAQFRTKKRLYETQYPHLPLKILTKDDL